MMERVFRSINRTIKRDHQFHLTNTAEQKDLSCKPMLGMKKYFDAKLQALPNVRTWAAPCKKSQSVDHGGFDDDKATKADPGQFTPAPLVFDSLDFSCSIKMKNQGQSVF